ncbi:hypothetical protein M8C21_019902 [Ambrosia artemisiifolia]|uniref:Uncharacterized protein n=1 Tax=Ambrosia artemisiifolia TaxID=4212 RepID=A0AAD5BXL3_AMBAR|nr:hypothetical protein M8C21_019902 [Ambrosia artemisiifolia]
MTTSAANQRTENPVTRTSVAVFRCISIVTTYDNVDSLRGKFVLQIRILVATTTSASTQFAINRLKEMLSVSFILRTLIAMVAGAMVVDMQELNLVLVLLNNKYSSQDVYLL